MDSAADTPAGPRLLPRVRSALQLRRLSPRTQQAYLAWMLPFIRHHDTRHPAAMGETEVLAFPNRLVARLLYGSGLRLMEPLSLQVKDFDFTRREVVVRRGKGGKDRVTMLPERLVAPLSRHLERVRAMHGRDLAWGGGAVALPDALERKVPSAALAWSWQWVFPAARRYRDLATGEARRWHLHASLVQREVAAAVRWSGIARRASCHTFQHCFATHLLAAGYDIGTVQELLGHRDLAPQ